MTEIQRTPYSNDINRMFGCLGDDRIWFDDNHTDFAISQCKVCFRPLTESRRSATQQRTTLIPHTWRLAIVKLLWDKRTLICQILPSRSTKAFWNLRRHTFACPVSCPDRSSPLPGQESRFQRDPPLRRTLQRATVAPQSFYKKETKTKTIR